MYWLLNEQDQIAVRRKITNLVTSLSVIQGNLHEDQLFPYVGRKDRRKAEVIIGVLTNENDIICDPFSGSGIFTYAATNNNRQILANEWEPYANRISSAPWRLPPAEGLNDAFSMLCNSIGEQINLLYWTRCPCGHDHTFYSLFFDRDPLRYRDVTPHERLGPNGETINYRRDFACPICGRTDKFFDDEDQNKIEEINFIPDDPFFDFELIENSRINLNHDFLIYRNLFPKRSRIALKILWNGIRDLECGVYEKLFLEDVFLSILPQAKYKDYRSKSQDLHCPPVMLREVNLFYAFQNQYRIRDQSLRAYAFHQEIAQNQFHNPINCLDFRTFYSDLEANSVDLIITDPPWTDGTAYFERAQLYHPWIGFRFLDDQQRLENEMVVTDAPTRRNIHNNERWWTDLDSFFNNSYRVLKSGEYLVLFFRPIPAAKWLENLNKLKLCARKNGFEPLLSIDVSSSDPSMRIQQSSSYVFSKDIVFVFLKLNKAIRRDFFEGNDLDQIIYKVAVDLQETNRSPFTFIQWRNRLSEKFIESGIPQLDNPFYEQRIRKLFERYCDEVVPPGGVFLPKGNTPFSYQLFDIPVSERLFTYVPFIINNLTDGGSTFTYEDFLLNLAEYVENGTRQLINEVQQINVRNMIEIYAEITDDGQRFQRRQIPQIHESITNILTMDPYDFEVFVANLFEAQGFTSIALLGRTGDRGVDIRANDPNNLITVIQCKRWRNNVGSTPIQRLHSFAVTRNAQRKILVTTSDFTPQAIEEALNTDTDLINGDRLLNLITQYLPNLV